MDKNINIECEKCKQRINLLTIIANLFLCLFKGIIGILGSSEVLVADGLYSFYQSFFSIKLMWSKKIEEKNTHDSSPLWFAGMIVGVILIFGSIDVFIFSFVRLGKAAKSLLVEPSPYALYIGILSILANQLLYKYNLCGGHKENNLNDADTRNSNYCGLSNKKNISENKLTQSLQMSIIVSSISVIGICFARYISIYGDSIAALIVIGILVSKTIVLFKDKANIQ